MRLPLAGREPLVSGLPEAVLAGGRFFTLGAHSAEVIGGGDDWEEHDEHASQHQQELQGR